MVKRLVIAAFLCIFIAIITLTSGASLVPMSWGFPVMTQHQTLSTMNMQFANATDLSTSAVSFPTSTSTSGILSSSFPTILQNGNQDADAIIAEHDGPDRGQHIRISVVQHGRLASAFDGLTISHNI